MKMKNTVVLIVCVLFVLKGNSQSNKGYYNSKFYISLDVLMNAPILYNFRSSSDIYSKYDENLNQKGDKFNHGFRASVGVILKRNFALCLEGGIDYSNVYLEKSIYHQDSTTGQNLNLIHQNLDIQTFSVMPKIEFSVKNSLLPLGLSHQFGIGFNRSKLVNHDYSSLVTYQSSFDNSYVLIDDFNKKYFDFSNQISTKTFTIMYALNMKTALSKSLLLNYGFRYTLNLNSSELNITSNSINQFYLSQQDVSELINKQRLYNLINFNLGLTYAF
jgi:hypothetical protein